MTLIPLECIHSIKSKRLNYLARLFIPTLTREILWPLIVYEHRKEIWHKHLVVVSAVELSLFVSTQCTRCHSVLDHGRYLLPRLSHVLPSDQQNI